MEGRLFQTLLVKRRRSGKQLVQEHAESVDVGSRVHVQAAEFGRFGTHISQRPDGLVHARVDRLVGQSLVQGLGDPKVDDFGHGYAVVQRNQYIRRFDVAMNDAFLVGVLDGFADLDEKCQSFS